MKVLYFHQYFSTPEGRTGTRSYEMACALVAAGHQVHIVCASDADGETGLVGDFVKGQRNGVVDGIEVTEFALPYSNEQSLVQRARLFLVYAIRSILVAWKTDCDVVFSTSTPLTAGIPGIVARWTRRRVFVFEVRDLWPELPRAMGVLKNPMLIGALSALEWMSYRSAHGCIGLSPGIVDGIRRRSSSKLPLAMIPNGADLALFDTKGVAPAVIEGVGDEDFVAMFTGQHGVANGLDAVLDAACLLKARDSKMQGAEARRRIVFVFIGAGATRVALIERAAREGLDNCLFLEPVSKTRLRSYLARADIALMILDNVPAFYYGTSPNKFFDYLAAGRPVLCNYPGWMSELVVAAKAGLVVPPEDPAAFVEALESLAADPSRAVSLGNNAATLAHEQFDREVLSEEFVQFLEARLKAHEVEQ